MGILLRGGVLVEPREFRHMAMEKQEKPKFQSPDKLLKLYEWPSFVVIAGIPGSGKTEWLLSLASVLAKPEQPVYLSDLTAERSFLCDRAIAVHIKRTMPDVYVLVPDNEDGLCDGRHIKPEIEWAVEHRKGRVLLDVGSNAFGAAILGDFKRDFTAGGYDFLLVVNPFDPRTADADNVRALKLFVEELSGLPVTGLVANAYRGCDDEPRHCAEGALSVLTVAQALELPLLYALATEEIAEKISTLLPEDLPVWSLSRILRTEGEGIAGASDWE